MAAAKNNLQKVLELTGTFVAMQKGEWNHTEWEHLLEKLQAQGIATNDESKRNLGNILEASKYFYFLTPGAPAKKQAAPRKRTASKAKATR